MRSNSWRKTKNSKSLWLIPAISKTGKGTWRNGPENKIKRQKKIYKISRSIQDSDNKNLTRRKWMRTWSKEQCKNFSRTKDRSDHIERVHLVPTLRNKNRGGMGWSKRFLNLVQWRTPSIPGSRFESMYQWVKAPATKPNNLCLIPRARIVEEENQLPQIVPDLWMCTVAHMSAYTHTQVMGKLC